MRLIHFLHSFSYSFSSLFNNVTGSVVLITRPLLIASLGEVCAREIELINDVVMLVMFTVCNVLGLFPFSVNVLRKIFMTRSCPFRT